MSKKYLYINYTKSLVYKYSLLIPEIVFCEDGILRYKSWPVYGYTAYLSD